ncbi:MAG TPA: hypothetical protein DHM90_11325 [Clostridiaceae bacterium]|jgi:hypothetical protein|nr:hypothetical protein [Clostridiaceae bacterium]
MKVCKLLAVSALSMAAGALIYKVVNDHKDEIDSFVNEYGEFIEDDMIDVDEMDHEPLIEE